MCFQKDDGEMFDVYIQICLVLPVKTFLLTPFIPCNDNAESKYLCNGMVYVVAAGSKGCLMETVSDSLYKLLFLQLDGIAFTRLCPSVSQSVHRGGVPYDHYP